MNYKKSNYNVEIEKLHDDRILIYNTYSGVYGIMDKKTYAIYGDIENQRIDSISDTEITKNIEIMYKSGYVVNIEKDELATLKLERALYRYKSNSLNIAIAPTMNCNMRCPYCYEDKNETIMSNEIQKDLIKFLKLQLNNNPTVKHIDVLWYGGEPLMQKEIINSISEQLLALCKEGGLSYSASIITNGVLLDRDTAKQLVENCKVKYAQITIDGIEEIHNKRRLLINGEDSFGIIMRNIEMCQDIIHVNVRVNVDKENADEIDKLTKYFIEQKGWISSPSFYLAPVENYTDTCSPNYSKCLRGDEFAKIYYKTANTVYTADRKTISNIFYEKRKHIFCGAESKFNYVVDPEGYIYNCVIKIGMKGYKIGHVSEVFVVNTEYGRWLLSDLHEKCEACKFLPLCMGGCGSFRLTGKKEPKCFQTFYNYKIRLKMAYEDYITQKAKNETTEV